MPNKSSIFTNRESCLVSALKTARNFDEFEKCFAFNGDFSLIQKLEFLEKHFPEFELLNRCTLSSENPEEINLEKELRNDYITLASVIIHEYGGIFAFTLEDGDT